MAAYAVIHDFPRVNQDMNAGIRQHDGGAGTVACVEVNGVWYHTLVTHLT